MFIIPLRQLGFTTVTPELALEIGIKLGERLEKRREAAITEEVSLLWETHRGNDPGQLKELQKRVALEISFPEGEELFSEVQRIVQEKFLKFPLATKRPTPKLPLPTSSGVDLPKKDVSLVHAQQIVIESYLRVTEVTARFYVQRLIEWERVDLAMEYCNTLQDSSIKRGALSEVAERVAKLGRIEEATQIMEELPDQDSWRCRQVLEEKASAKEFQNLFGGEEIQEKAIQTYMTTDVDTECKLRLCFDRATSRKTKRFIIRCALRKIEPLQNSEVGWRKEFANDIYGCVAIEAAKLGDVLFAIKMAKKYSTRQWPMQHYLRDDIFIAIGEKSLEQGAFKEGEYALSEVRKVTENYQLVAKFAAKFLERGSKEEALTFISSHIIEKNISWFYINYLIRHLVSFYQIDQIVALVQENVATPISPKELYFAIGKGVAKLGKIEESKRCLFFIQDLEQRRSLLLLLATALMKQGRKEAALDQLKELPSTFQGSTQSFNVRDDFWSLLSLYIEGDDLASATQLFHNLPPFEQNHWKQPIANTLLRKNKLKDFTLFSPLEENMQVLNQALTSYVYDPFK